MLIFKKIHNKTLHFKIQTGKKHTSNYFLHKWVNLNTQYVYSCLYFFSCFTLLTFTAASTSHLSGQQLPSVSVPTFCSPEGRQWIPECVSPPAMWLVEQQFRWALRLCLCTKTPLSASQSTGTPQQSETRRTLVCKLLITDSEHRSDDLTYRSGGASSFSHREETLSNHWHES